MSKQLASGLGLLLIGFGAASLSGRAAPLEPAELRAQRFVLVDAAGKERLEINSTAQFTGIAIATETGFARLGVGLGTDGTPVVNLIGPEKWIACSITLDKDGKPIVIAGKSSQPLMR